MLYDIILLVLGIVVIFGGLLIYQFEGIKRRRNRLKGRPILTDEEWFRQNMPARKAECALVRNILMAFSDEIGVHWTQLRVTDTFNGELRVASKFAYGDDLDGASACIEKILADEGRPLLRVSRNCCTLGQFIDCLFPVQQSNECVSMHVLPESC